MEGLVKLVEAVKLVDTTGVQVGQDGESVPDGRIWAEGTGIELDDTKATHNDSDTPSGRDLLRHSSRAQDGLYVVDADKNK